MRTRFKFLKVIDEIFILYPMYLIDFVTRTRVSLYIYYFLGRYLNKTFENQGILFDVGEKSAAVRAKALMTAEPDTIDWIDSNLSEGDTLYDIGANIGAYSLYAAKVKGGNVYAFEAESSSYYYLNKNIYLNKLEEKILAFNLAVNDVNEFSYLNLSKFNVASSKHNFKDEIDPNHVHFKPAFKQGVLGLSLDFLVYDIKGIQFPNLIKIDVDGNEYKIIKGMTKILKDCRLKTVAVELNEKLEVDMKIVDIILGNGFKQIDNKHLKNSENKSGIYNLFFKRIQSI